MEATLTIVVMSHTYGSYTLHLAWRWTSHPICRFSFKKSRLGSIFPLPTTSDRESMREPPFAACWWTPVLSDSSGTTTPPTVDVSNEKLCRTLLL